MKKLLLLPCICAAHLAGADNLETMVQKAGLYGKYKTVAPAYDPFVIQPSGQQSQNAAAQQNRSAGEAERSVFEPTAIMNNKVFIAGRWYEQGDTYADYAIVRVDDPYVIAATGGKTMTFNINKNKNFMQIKTKRDQ
ncbi:MAG: hypothetical protein ACQERK_07515 [Campylobacterota bacterium]